MRDGQRRIVEDAIAVEDEVEIERAGAAERGAGAAAFLFDRDTPGFRIVRRIPIMGPEEHGGHCEIEFDDMEIADDARLMNVGDGLKVTQIRLGPARLTHCMRWLGLARRALSIAIPYVEMR